MAYNIIPLSAYNLPAGTASTPAPGQSTSQQQSTNVTRSQNTADALSQQYSRSYIPEYSQTPILEEIARYSRQMAPQVYQWGMDQFNRNQGNIDALMQTALSYASPQRIRSDMGMAEAGVMQGAEAGRQSAIRDLQSFGIDPSSGRYAALDNASRVQAAASAAGAGNQQRMANLALSNTMQNQAVASGLQNVQTGYGAANAANALLGTASSLRYAPLGTESAGQSASTSQGTSTGDAQSTGSSGSQAYAPAGSAAAGFRGLGLGDVPAAPSPLNWAGGFPPIGGAAEGGHIGYEESPSAGAKVDDVPANLTAGEFVIPKDVAEWFGQGHFYKLMAQARKARAMSGNSRQAQVGYGAAG